MCREDTTVLRAYDEPFVTLGRMFRNVGSAACREERQLPTQEFHAPWNTFTKYYRILYRYTSNRDFG